MGAVEGVEELVPHICGRGVCSEYPRPPTNHLGSLLVGIVLRFRLPDNAKGR